MSTAIDLGTLEVSTGGDRPLMRRLLAIWLWKSREVLGLVDPDASDEDWIYAVHTLRSAAIAIGASEVAARAAEAKSVVRPERDVPERRERALDELTASVEAASEDVSRLLARL